MSSKPVFIFFKMFNCGHCTQFAEMPTAEKSPWAELLNDEELKKTVNFMRYDFGVETKNGQTVRHKLPEQYSFVNYGPYFYMHQTDNVEHGLEFTPAEAQKHGRTAKGLKNWVRAVLAKDPKMATSGALPVSAPVVQPAFAKSPSGATSSGFQSQKPDLRQHTPSVVQPNPQPAVQPVPNPAAKIRNSKVGVRVPAEVPAAPMAIRARNRKRR